MKPIVTHVGFADFGDFDHFGKRLYRDLGGKTSFLGLAVFGLTGKKLSAADTALLDDVAVTMHCPEPRVWPVKLARIAASRGRFAPGMVVSWSVLDSVVGVGVGIGAAELFVELGQCVEGAADEEAAIVAFVRDREAMPGFGVYGRRIDERVAALRGFVEAHGRQGSKYWRLAETLWPLAQRERNLDPSFWAAVVTILLDLGIPPQKMEPILGLLFQPSYMSHALEGAELQSPDLQRMPDAFVHYVGEPPRLSPRARGRT